MPLSHPFRHPPGAAPEPQAQPPGAEPQGEPPFEIWIEHLDVTLGGHFRPAARVSFAAPLRTSGLLASLAPEAVKDLLLLLTFVTPNGHCAPTLGQVAQAMRVSQGKARSRLERLEAARWQAQSLIHHGASESGLEFFSPLPAIAPVREDATAPSASVPPPPILAAGREAVIAHSRAAYARPRAEVEAQIEAMMGYRKAAWTPKPSHAPLPAPASPQGVAPAPEPATPAPLPPSPEELEALREREEVGELLLQAGLDAEQAQGLLDRYDLVRIRRQLMWLPYRRAKNPAGMLLAAVKDDYEAPPMARYQQATPTPAMPSDQAPSPQEPPLSHPSPLQRLDLDPGHDLVLPMPDERE